MAPVGGAAAGCPESIRAMAATINVTCTQCETTIKASAEVEGKKVRCKSCGAVFVARAGAPAKSAAPAKATAPAKGAKPAKAPAEKDIIGFKDDEPNEEDDGKAYGVNEEKLGHRCPECANAMESDDAVICLHCGYNTITRTRAGFKKTYDITALDYLIHLGPGILCLLGIIGLAIYDVLYVMYADEWFDTNTWYGTVMAHGAMKMWKCLLSVYFMYLMGKFAFHRLIMDRHPPEIEKGK
jgi:hypothetical protein